MHASNSPTPWRWLGSGAIALLLSACGGGGGSPETASSPASPGGNAAVSQTTPAQAIKPASRGEAMRFLMQASFGPTEADIERVMQVGYSAWIDEQMALPASSHRANWEASDQAARARDAKSSAGTREVLDSFYKVAITGQDQLRQRVAYALSQVFVVSMAQDNVADQPRGVASYMDLLAGQAFGNYRSLLEGVALHPVMGRYLSHQKNQKEDPLTGRVPDENFAREVMQLFSIGLHELQTDGSPRLQDGKPIPAYGAEDIAGMARVFTGFSWDGPDTADGRFWGWCPNYCSSDRDVQPMQGYNQFHSLSEKRFLGQTIPAQTKADPQASLKKALDTLSAHPNVGPFLARQMIQRLVSSHPSPAYVGRVAQAFGPRGDLRAMVKAVLLDSEARDPAMAQLASAGKLQEPVLRLTQALRALGASSDSGAWLIGSTDDAGSQLGQSPLRSPSVFNFYRPGYVAPGTETGARQLTAPELQIVHETSVAGYANYMLSGVRSGFGQYGVDWKASRPDVRFSLDALIALADRPAELVQQLGQRLLGDRASGALSTEIQNAVESVRLDALKSDASNQKTVDDQRRNRAMLAVYLTLMAPEYLVLK